MFFRRSWPRPGFVAAKSRPSPGHVAARAGFFRKAQKLGRPAESFRRAKETSRELQEIQGDQQRALEWRPAESARRVKEQRAPGEPRRPAESPKRAKEIRRELQESQGDQQGDQQRAAVPDGRVLDSNKYLMAGFWIPTSAG